MNFLEISLLLVALIAAFYFASDLARQSRRERRERFHLEKLGTGEVEQLDELPPRPGPVTRRLRAAGLNLHVSVLILLALLLGMLVYMFFWSLVPEFPLGAIAAAGVFLYLLWV